MHRRFSLWTAGLWFVLALASCAKSRDPINRVQPNYVDKKALDGVWYYQRTVVDMPASNGYTFIGATDQRSVSRVSWDVQQDYLYARRYMELVKGADGKEPTESAQGKYMGEVVAAFRIQKHFDVARPYNDTTGEELNVLVENDFDRPWHDRRYMRVDWSRNLVNNYSLDFERTTVESVPYFVQEFDPVTGRRNPDAPFFELAEGYFDVTTKLFAAGGTVDFPGRGKVPLCMLDELVECGSAEYTIRHSFKRIPAENTYQPRFYKGEDTELFGFFWTDRLNYDSQNGIMEQARERYLNRFNLWKNEGGVRVPKPVVYHVNSDWPKDDTVLMDAARATADRWNEVLVDVVKATGAAPPERMLILCEHNPVQEGDPEACGEAGDEPRVGDLRYSFFAYIPKYMTYGLLGFGPANVDPETGEILSSSVYVYHHNNIAAFRTQEMIELLNGTMGPTDYLDNVDLTSWKKKALANAETPTTFPVDANGPFIKSLARGPSSTMWDANRQPPSVADELAQHANGAASWIKPHFRELYEARTALRADTDTSRGKLRGLVGTDVEDMLLNDEVYTGTGIDPRMPLTEDAKGQTSVARGGFGKFYEERARIRNAFAHERNLYLPEMADDALLGLARELAEQKLSREQVYDIVRGAIYRSVLAHELGHNLGLMHNFSGSDDALNYFDEYWRLRAADGTVGPRMVDPITTAEVQGKIYSHAYSSIMDYAARYTVDERGPGKYDRAALLFGYADKVEVFVDGAGVPHQDFRDWYETDGDVLRFTTTGPKAVHYTSYYNRMGEKLFRRSNRVLVDVKELTPDFSADKTGRSRVPYLYCSHNRSDLLDHCLARDFGADSAERMKNLMDEVDTWYVTRNFPRGIIGNTTANFVSRYYGNVYGRLKHWSDSFVLYKELLPRFYNADQLTAFYTDPVEGWATKVWGVQNGFNKLAQTVLMPDIGGYKPVTEPDGASLLRRASTLDAPVQLGIDNARYYATNWDSGNRNCGYAWWECLHHVGFYLDKIMAIEALTDTSTNFVARTTPDDLREWRLGYYNLFPEQIGRINRAILGQDWTRVGPYMEGGEMRFPNYAGAMDQAHASALDPFATFSVQVYWQVLGLSRFPSTFDQSFTDESRLFILGTGTAPLVDGDWRVAYRDPFTGLSFGALKIRNGTGAGEAIINRANMLLARSPYCDPAGLTETGADNCVEPTGGHTRESSAALLREHNELIRALLTINSRLNLGEPYNPQKP